MGESWSDLVAMEYLNSNGFVPVAGENPFAVGPYVTGGPVAEIHHGSGMNDGPLNYSDVGYDLTGPRSTPTARSGARRTSISAVRYREPGLAPGDVRRLPVDAVRRQHGGCAGRVPGRRPDPVRRRPWVGDVGRVRTARTRRGRLRATRTQIRTRSRASPRRSTRRLRSRSTLVTRTGTSSRARSCSWGTTRRGRSLSPTRRLRRRSGRPSTWFGAPTTSSCVPPGTASAAWRTWPSWGRVAHAHRHPAAQPGLAGERRHRDGRRRTPRGAHRRHRVDELGVGGIGDRGEGRDDRPRRGPPHRRSTRSK